MLENLDRNNALRRTESANYIIESYYTDPGDCLCGHMLTHHTPAAIGRFCVLCDCALLISSTGVIPARRVSIMKHSRPEPEPGDWKGAIAHSLHWQSLKTHRLTQQAIERIYNER